MEATKLLDNSLVGLVDARGGSGTAPSLAALAQLMQRHGVAEAQRLLGPARFVEALVRLRQAGFDL